MDIAMPRIVHRAYAWLFAYFWKPCPICERMFGGHEEPRGFLKTGYYTSLVVCALCIDRADEKNKRNSYTGVLHLTLHNNKREMMTFPSRWQAEYYLHMIPMLQADGNEEALRIRGATLDTVMWTEAT